MSDLNDEQIETLLRKVADVDVPEPSPLFWDHFAARVNAAIDAAPRRRPWWQAPIVLASTAAAAVLVLSMVAFYALRPAQQRGDDMVAAVQAPRGDISTASAESPNPDAVDIENDEAWAIVRSFADELHYDDARDAGVVPGPGSVERAAIELSPDERAELLRIIETELKRAGA